MNGMSKRIEMSFTQRIQELPPILDLESKLGRFATP